MVATAPNGYAPFVFGNRYTWVEAEEDSGIEGFRAEVRVNLPNGELRAFLDAVAHLDRKRAELLFEQTFDLTQLDKERRQITIDGDREALTANLTATEAVRDRANERMTALDRETWGLIAPHVRDWNAYHVGPDGTPVKSPPPAEDPETSFELIETSMITWLISTISTAYRSGKGLKPPSTKPPALLEPMPEPSSGPQVVGE